MKKLAFVMMAAILALSVAQKQGDGQFYLTTGENFSALVRVYPEVFTGDLLLGFNEYSAGDTIAIDKLPLKITEYTFTGVDGEGALHFTSSEHDYVTGDVSEQEVTFNADGGLITLRNPVGGANIQLNVEESGGLLSVSLANADDFETFSLE